MKKDNDNIDNVNKITERSTQQNVHVRSKVATAQPRAIVIH